MINFTLSGSDGTLPDPNSEIAEELDSIRSVMLYNVYKMEVGLFICSVLFLKSNIGCQQ